MIAPITKIAGYEILVKTLIQIKYDKPKKILSGKITIILIINILYIVF